MDEALLSEVAKFVKANKENFSEAESWTDTFDSLNKAWEFASVSGDWKKILCIAAKCSEDMEVAYYVLYQGRYRTSTHPSNLIIENALEEGKKAIKSVPDDLIDLAKAIGIVLISRT